MMYCGYYSEDKKEADTFIYLAVNMHWIPHTFALPKLPKKLKWHLVYDTDSNSCRNEQILKQQEEVTINERSIRVLIAK